MKDEHFRLTIVKILDDIRGDNPFPSDEVVQANASLLYQNYLNKLTELEQKIKEKMQKRYNEEFINLHDKQVFWDSIDDILRFIAKMKEPNNID